jgi:hypothetical protein
MVDDLQVDGFPTVIEECAIGNGQLTMIRRSAAIVGLFLFAYSSQQFR